MDCFLLKVSFSESSRQDMYMASTNPLYRHKCFSLHFRIPLCSLVNQHLHNLARKFQDTKFIKSVSSVCIPNYPDKNLPTIFVYFEGEMKKQWVGPLAFGGMNLKQDGKHGNVKFW